MKKPEMPESPGVYIMKDAKGKTLYVGKAKNLSKRVSSYFSGKKDEKTNALLSRVEKIEPIVTENEVEALLLENNLIKEKKPRYNISLKDDKTYPFVEITLGEKFPRVCVTRKKSSKKSKYFGPYPDVSSLRKTVRLVRKLFCLRSCKKLKKRAQPCINHEIGICSAPCAEKISEKDYLGNVEKAALFFEGKFDVLQKQLEKQMKAFSMQQKYEQAAAARDALALIKKTLSPQSVSGAEEKDADFLGFATDGENNCFETLFLRKGKLVGHKTFILPTVFSEQEDLGEFLKQRYLSNPLAPPKVVLPFETPDRGVLTLAVEKKTGKKTVFKKASKKDHGVMSLANKNAQTALGEGSPGVLELSKILGLSKPPRKIEAFDVSNLFGEEAVGSMVVFVDGEPEKSLYRRFRIKTKHSPDDTEMMREVLSRRYSRVLKEKLELPDLVLVDGGKPQLNVALRVFSRLGISTPVVGLAKKHEEIHSPARQTPYVLPPKNPARLLLQRVRDEAHRFAVTYHRLLRSKKIKQRPKNKIVVTPLASDSMGTRSMATYVETPDVKILIDPSVALAPRRSSLPPHPVEKKREREHWGKIRKYAEKASVLVVTHYHYDHHNPLFPEIYAGKTVLLKNPLEKINKSQKSRAKLFLKKLGKMPGQIQYADGKTFVFGKTRLVFSQPVTHGDNDYLGYVLELAVRREKECFLFTSDVLGPCTPQQTDFILDQNPDLLLVDGPMPFSVEEAVEKLSEILQKTRVKTIIVDHHGLRDAKWRDKLSPVFEKAREKNVELVCAAEYLGEEPELLETMRKKLYKQQPV